MKGVLLIGNPLRVLCPVGHGTVYAFRNPITTPSLSRKRRFTAFDAKQLMIFDFSSSDLSLIFETAEDGTLHLRHLAPVGAMAPNPLPSHPAPVCELQVTGENPYGQRGAIHHGLYGSKHLLYRSHTCTDLPDGRILSFVLYG